MQHNASGHGVLWLPETISPAGVAALLRGRYRERLVYPAEDLTPF